MGKILPVPTAVTDPYWQGCRSGELRLQQCGHCEQYQFYPRTLCSHCGHRELSWRAASGHGRIATYTVVHQPLSDAYTAPLVVALVDLAEGPRMMSSIEGLDPDAVAVGQPVTVAFAQWSEDIAMPVFRPATEE